MADAFGATTTDEDLASLDFEGQAAAAGQEAPEAPQEPAAEADEQPNTDYEPADWPEFELPEELQGLSPEELYEAAMEELEVLAEDDPMAAAEILGQAQATQAMRELAAEWEAELGPVAEKHYADEAEGQVGELEGEFGAAFVAAHRQALAKQVEADPEAFLNPETRMQRMRDFMAARAYEAELAYERGDDIREGMAQFTGPESRDIFGAIERPPQAEASAPPRDVAASRFVPAGQPAEPRVVSRETVQTTAFVEGGSTPAPQGAAPSSDPDAEFKAAIRGSGGRDIFGRLP